MDIIPRIEKRLSVKVYQAFIIFITTFLVFGGACVPIRMSDRGPDNQSTSPHTYQKKVTEISKTFVSEVPLGPVTQEILQKAKDRYEHLIDLLREESDSVTKQIVQHQALLAEMNYYDLLPMPYRDRISQAGRGVTIAVIDGGIFPETVEYLGAKFLGYHEMQPDFSIIKKMNPRVFPLKRPALIGSGDYLIERVYNHGDDMIRFINRIAPDANTLCINNYNRNHTRRIKGLLYEMRVYDAPLSISKSIRYLREKIHPPRPFIISISEGINPHRSIDPQLLSEMKEQFRLAHTSGYLIVIAAGNITNYSKDSYKLGINLGIDCPWVIPVGAVDHNNRALKSARFDPENRVKVLYAPARSSSVATAKVAGLVSLILEKAPSLNPDQVNRILFETADYHRENNNRSVYIINIDRAITSIK